LPFDSGGLTDAVSLGLGDGVCVGAGVSASLGVGDGVASSSDAVLE
jgi:hypothetical protein